MGHHQHQIDVIGEPLKAFCQGELHFAWLEITQHCNLRCMHCYTTSSPAKPHNDIDWADIIRQVHALGCRQIQLIGGEPLTHPDFKSYIELARSLDFDFIEVFTNACLLDEDLADFLARHKVDVATSFYATVPSAHDRMTVTVGSFEQTLNGIRNAVNAGLVLRVGVMMLEDDAETAEQKYDYLEALGVDRKLLRTDEVRPVGRGSKMTPYVSRQDTLCGACWQGKLVISYDGNCYPCVMSRDVTVGNIKEQSVQEVVSGHILSAFRASYGGEVVARQKAWAAEAADQGEAVQASDCGPNCGPSGPCSPNCSPKCSPPCFPDNCGPVNPSCGPNDGGCIPYHLG